MKKALYLAYQILIAFPIMLAATVAAAVICMAGCLFDNRFWGYWPGKIWGWLFTKVFLTPVHVHGREYMKKGQSYVIVANHQSYWDAFVMYGYLGTNFKWLMKAELRKLPLVGWACNMSGHVFVERQSAAKSAVSLRQAESRVSDGISLMVFPEGTRTHDGRMARFKRGAFQIAEELQLPILPVAIDGDYEVMSRHDWHAHRHPVHVTFHEPVYPRTTAETDEEEKMRIMRDTADRVAAIIQNTLDRGY